MIGNKEKPSSNTIIICWRSRKNKKTKLLNQVQKKRFYHHKNTTYIVERSANLRHDETCNEEDSQSTPQYLKEKK